MSKGDIFKMLLKTVGAPIIAALVPGGPIIAAVIEHGIGEAEQMPGATSARKKAHVVSLVHDAMSGINAGLAASGKPALADTVGLDHAVSQGIDAAIEGINSVKKHTAPAA